MKHDQSWNEIPNQCIECDFRMCFLKPQISANMVPSLSYGGEGWTASRKNVKGTGTWLSNPNSATARLFKDSTQIIEKSDRSISNNRLDPHSNNRLVQDIDLRESILMIIF